MLYLLALAVIAFAAAAGWIAASLFGKGSVGRARAQLEATEAELKAQQSSQAQVIHTTKLASLGQMVAGVAHELNTPLGFVKSNCEVIGDLLGELEAEVEKLVEVSAEVVAHPHDAALREQLEAARHRVATNAAAEDARALLRDCLEGVDTLTGLVRNLKGFARVDRDGVDSVDLNDSVKSALAVVAHLLRDRVKVLDRLTPLPKVRCMPSQINQVFLNLLTNAAQAIEDRGTIVVASRVLDGAVEVAFTDTGSGIPPEVMPRIFDPFYTTKPVGEGTGLGLSIAHKIVKAHGGDIGVRTALGRGTTFTVTLPTSQAQDAPSAQAA